MVQTLCQELQLMYSKVQVQVQVQVKRPIARTLVHRYECAQTAQTSQSSWIDTGISSSVHHPSFPSNLQRHSCPDSGQPASLARLKSVPRSAKHCRR